MKRFNDFINENTKEYNTASDYLLAHGFVLENGLWNYNKSIIIENKQRPLFIKNNKLNVKFGEIKGDFTFSCGGSDNKLTSIEGLPIKCINLDISYNNITSLEGIGSFHSLDVANNKITSLKGLPKNIEGSIDLQDNELTSLKDGPEKIGTYFDVSGNNLTDLQGSPIVGSSFYIHDNNLKTFYGLKYIDRHIYIADASDDIPEEEEDFLMSKVSTIGYTFKDYAIELIEYTIKKFGAVGVRKLNLPEICLNALPNDIKNIYTSANGLKRFNL